MTEDHIKRQRIEDQRKWQWIEEGAALDDLEIMAADEIDRLLEETDALLRREGHFLMSQILNDVVRPVHEASARAAKNDDLLGRLLAQRFWKS